MNIPTEIQSENCAKERAIPSPYEILTRAGGIRNRNLTPARATNRPDKERVMLDLGFVALGFAIIALMALYAMALGQI